MVAAFFDILAMIFQMDFVARLNIIHYPSPHNASHMSHTVLNRCRMTRLKTTGAYH